MVPPGTTNLALHKPVSGSDSDPVIGNLEMITDGNKARLTRPLGGAPAGPPQLPTRSQFDLLSRCCCM
jgi:hypothetical protein